MQKILSMFVLLLSLSTSIAQTKDSVQQKVRAVVTDKFPITRVLNLTYESNTGYRYSSKLQGQDLPKTKVESMYQAGGSININFLKSRTWNLGTNIGYQFTSVNSNRLDPIAQSTIQSTHQYHYHYESLNLTRYSRLWGKVAFYTATVAANGSEKAIERINGILSATVVLKATREIQMAVGLIGFIDPAAIIPVLPTFAYKQQFANGMILDVILPKGVYLRKEVLRNGRVSIGSDLNSTIFYLYNFQGAEKVYTFSQMEINSGLTYEHNLGRSFIATLKSGLKTIPRARVFEKNKTQRDYVWEANPDPSFYINAGLSFNPFAKKRK
ncbi:hypothetical protein [Sphingobacterium sp. 40-24]|uniref:hypothetical protein n=1 Tax=Sphingobacterium sp. 40-24 TaxID=1895843 RepID=UPI00095FBE1C|nr:hypothetical protein [Sphingobacterium sp. 40-24]OJZ00154.1 MAG: hypothetical protein BGP15_00725 [Sphingobacterium sp. 40-24]